jgi:hypothetical protein
MMPIQILTLPMTNNIISHWIGTNRKCLICNKEGNDEVKIIDVIREGEDFKLILSCGHTPKFNGYTLEEK